MTNSTEDNMTELLRLARSSTMSEIARSITEVQPISAVAGSVFTLNATYEQSIIGPWEKRFVFFPRRSVYGGRRIMGHIFRREVKHQVGVDFIEHPFGGDMRVPRYKTEYEYATDKEIFIHALEGDSSGK